MRARLGQRVWALAAMKVLHVAQPIQPGGVPTVVAALVRGQEARGIGVSIATPAESALTAELSGTGVELHSWSATRAPGPSTPRETASLARVIREIDPEIVHLHSSK